MERKIPQRESLTRAVVVESITGFVRDFEIIDHNYEMFETPYDQIQFFSQRQVDSPMSVEIEKSSRMSGNIQLTNEFAGIRFEQTQIWNAS